MATAILRRGVNGSGQKCLAAIDDVAADVLAALPIGKDVEVEFHGRRNPRQHRLFFALLKMVIEGGGWDGTMDGLLTMVKLRLGHVDHIECGPYGAQIVPKSISFASMDQSEFRAFFDRAAHFLLSERMGVDDAKRAEMIDALEARYRDPREKAA